MSNNSRQGAKVSIAARRPDRLEQVADECRALGGEVLVVPIDRPGFSRLAGDQGVPGTGYPSRQGSAG